MSEQHLEDDNFRAALRLIANIGQVNDGHAFCRVEVRRVASG
jgi:hypothetical protein